MMYRNLEGEVLFDVSDMVNLILKSEEFKQRYRLIIKQGTKMGFYLHSNFAKAPPLSKQPGIYAIYRGDDPFYVGATKTSIHARIGRFVKEVQGNSRPTERHSSAKVFRGLYGVEDLDRLYVSFLRGAPPKYIDINKVEKHVIHAITPYANKANR
jgi:hypothetical protein